MLLLAYMYHAQKFNSLFLFSSDSCWPFVYFQTLAPKQEKTLKNVAIIGSFFGGHLFVCLFEVRMSTDKMVYFKRSYMKGMKKKKERKEET